MYGVPPVIHRQSSQQITTHMNGKSSMDTCMGQAPPRPRRDGQSGLTWFVLIVLVNRAVATSSIVHTVDELRRAVANSSVNDITLSGEAPFRFDSSWPIPGAGLSALLVRRTLTLSAAAGRRAVLDAGASASGMRRVLEVSAGGHVTLVRVEVTGGMSDHSGGGVLVMRDGSLALEDSVIRRNSVLGITTHAWGGGIFSNGHLTATRSRISDNNATSLQSSINAWVRHR